METSLSDKLLGISSLGTEWVLWLLILLSVMSVAVIIERLLFFQRIKIDFQAFAQDLTDRLAADDLEGAKQLCYSNPSPECQTVLRGMSYIDKGTTAMTEGMQGYLTGERQILDKGLVILGTLGNNAPFIGLFGTVIGIIQAFSDLAANPAGGASVVMGSVSEALIATAVGLLVAIPAVVSFNLFQRVVKRRITNGEAIMKILTAHFSK